MKLIIIIILAISFTMFSEQKNLNPNEAKGLSVGTTAPYFKAIDHENAVFDLKESLKKGPVVLIFYRGQWCPVCNRHLSQIQDSLDLILERGASVVAVSPEKTEYLNKTIEKTGVQFRLLYDENYRISNSYDVTFHPDKKQVLLYNTVLKANLKEANTDDTERLPIPATYIIRQDGTIVWRQFDPDYKKRSSVKDILKNLPRSN